MFICVIGSAFTALVSATLGFGSYLALGDGPRSALLAVAAISTMVAVGSLEAFEAQGPSRRNDDH